ncbi:MAG: hypothetical protein O3B73_07465 [bacterium]|nr:hypothetical protein [bacterium]
MFHALKLACTTRTTSGSENGKLPELTVNATPERARVSDHPTVTVLPRVFLSV